MDFSGWAKTAVLASVLALGCSDSTSGGGAGAGAFAGPAGTGGVTGLAGTGGVTGVAGTGGFAGVAGTGGATNVAGAAGTSSAGMGASGGGGVDGVFDGGYRREVGGQSDTSTYEGHIEDSGERDVVANVELSVEAVDNGGTMEISYTAKYTKISSGYMGQLVEWPEVITEGRTIEECREMLRDALREMILAYKQQEKESNPSSLDYQAN